MTYGDAVEAAGCARRLLAGSLLILRSTVESTVGACANEIELRARAAEGRRIVRVERLARIVRDICAVHDAVPLPVRSTISIRIRRAAGEDADGAGALLINRGTAAFAPDGTRGIERPRGAAGDRDAIDVAALLRDRGTCGMFIRWRARERTVIACACELMRIARRRIWYGIVRPEAPARAVRDGRRRCRRADGGNYGA